MTRYGWCIRKMKRHASICISSKDAGVCLLDFLCHRFTYQNRKGWGERVREGRVLINGKPAPPLITLNAGDRLEYLHADQAEPPVDNRYSILFEDESLLVVEKPANLPCHPGGRYFQNTLWSFLKRDFSMNSVCFVNRIDRETSGIVLVAKTAAAADDCRKQFLDGTPRKRYRVAVEGHFPHGVFWAEGFIGRDANSLIRKKQRFFKIDEACGIVPKPQRCCTLFCLEKTANGKSLLSAEPLTGRTHQIRATLCSLGYPVTGDKIYGVDETLFLRFIDDRLTFDDRQKLSLPRQALHAESLELKHPESGRKVCFVSPLPQDMAGLF